MIYLLSGILLGWGLGANDSANVFGIAVYTKAVKYKYAVILTAIFVIIGAYLDGGRGMDNVGNYAAVNGVSDIFYAFIVMACAAVTVIALTIMKLPISTSQAVIGSIMGAGIYNGSFDWSRTVQFASAWILTPFGALIISYLILIIYEKKIEKHVTGFEKYEIFIKTGFLISGIFAAYSLGANNVANVTGIYPQFMDNYSTKFLSLAGGTAIALGALTYSKPVMSTVGEKIVKFSAVHGLIIVVSSSLTVFIYAKIGIPVSTSQAVIGAVIGIGLKKGVNTINFRMIRNILLGWIATPLSSMTICLIIFNILKLFQK